MHQKEMILEQIETDKVIVALRKDDIIHVFFKKGIILDPALQDEMIPYYHRMTNGRKLPFIFEADANIGVTREARHRALSLEDVTPLTCAAVYAQNFIYRLLGDFYLLVKRPKTPYMVFTDFREGISWLLDTHRKLN